MEEIQEIQVQEYLDRKKQHQQEAKHQLLVYLVDLVAKHHKHRKKLHQLLDYLEEMQVQECLDRKTQHQLEAKHQLQVYLEDLVPKHRLHRKKQHQLKLQDYLVLKIRQLKLRMEY